MKRGTTSTSAYPSQIAALAFIASVTFKVLMLPRYFAGECGRQFWLAAAIMITLDIAVFAFVYKIACAGGLRSLDIPLAVKNTAIVLAVVGSAFKAVLFCSETVAYAATTLFDVGLWRLVLAGLVPALAYIAYKGFNVIARVAQVAVWLVGAVVVLNILLADFNGDPDAVLPVMPDAGVVSACDKYLFWFGDFTPLMFCSVAVDMRRKHVPVLISLAFIALFTIGFTVALACVFGGGTTYASFAFAKLSVFNKLSKLLGALDFPVVSAWLIMATIKLSLLVTTIAEGTAHFVGHRGAAAVIAAVVVGLVCKLAVGNVGAAHDFFTGGVRYLAAVVEYAVPMSVYAAWELSRRRRQRRAYA